MAVPDIPESLRASTVGYFGEPGRAWLQTLPGLIEAAAARWQLRLTAASANAGAGFVAFARDADGRDVVLKIAFPHGEHFTGVRAMRAWDGQGSVRLVDAAADDTEILMERVLPGTHLYELADEDQETRIAAEVMLRLRRAPGPTCPLPPHRTWVDKALRRIAASDVSEALLPRRLVRALEQITADLEALERPVVLHGDLHHENILLDARRGWLAIDPKGLVGDPALEVGRYCGNQLQRAEQHAGGYGALVDRRLEVFAAVLGEPVERLRAAAAVDILNCMGWELEHADFDRRDFARNRDRALHLVG